MDAQLDVLLYLKGVYPEYVSPTSIGLAIGGKTVNGIQRHSAWACPILKRLVARGKVNRNERGWYQYNSMGW